MSDDDDDFLKSCELIEQTFASADQTVIEKCKASRKVEDEEEPEQSSIESEKSTLGSSAEETTIIARYLFY